jgi:Mg2+/Co2+ transporter CorB
MIHIITTKGLTIHKGLINHSIMFTVVGLNFSHRNPTRCGSLAPTRLSFASSFCSCSFLRLYVSLTQKGFHNCLVVKKNKHKQSTSKLQEEVSTFIYLVNKGLHNKSVCAMHRNHMLHSKGFATYL